MIKNTIFLSALSLSALSVSTMALGQDKAVADTDTPAPTAPLMPAGQDAQPTAPAASDMTAPAPLLVAPPQATQQLVLPANTEVVMAMNEDLTTKGGKIEAGSMFALTVVSDVKIGNVTVIPRGARGTGEVTWKTGKAVFGKSGKMDVELRSVEVGGRRIEVEGKYRQEGEGSTIAAVGAVFVAAPLLFITGKSARIPEGRELIARTKYDIPVAVADSARAPAAAAPLIVSPPTAPGE